MILPPALAFIVMFIKETALASQVGVIEVTAVGKNSNNVGYQAMWRNPSCKPRSRRLRYKLLWDVMTGSGRAFPERETTNKTRSWVREKESRERAIASY